MKTIITIILLTLTIPIFAQNTKTYSLHEAEELPEYIGGNKEMSNFLNDNIVYPKISKKNKIQGKVLISFSIEPDGTLTNIRIGKSSYTPNEGDSDKIIQQYIALDEEALRVIKLMGKWKPGKIAGEGITIDKISIPIVFKL